MAEGKTRKNVLNFKAARPAALIIAFWLLVIHIGGIALFTSGFLLTRPVFDDVASGPVDFPAQFDRAVILVVDALRYDFAVPATAEEEARAPFYLNQLPFQDISQDSSQSFLVKFLADPPTTTLQRLKGLTTGSLPTFIDAGSNFAGSEIHEDNWLAQARALGNVTLAGDDTWYALYGYLFDEAYPYDSLNVRDLDTVDNGVKEHLPGLIANKENKIVIGHMLGVDHVGHRYGPNHTSMKTKLQETGQFIREVAEQIDDTTVLFVFGDHGMDQVGNHGGDSIDELEAALWVYTKKQNAFSAEGETTVRQIDLVPTISALLGIPVPFNNLGYPIKQAFGNGDAFEHASIATAKQISRYAEKFGKTLFQGQTIGEAHTYQQKLLDDFSESWVKFNIPKMIVGIAIIGLSALFMTFVYNALHAFSLSVLARTMSIGGAAGIIGGAVFSAVTSTVALNDLLINLAAATAIGALLGSLISLTYRPVAAGSWYTAFAVAALALECAIVFSNSYVIWEPKILNFLLVTILLGLLVPMARSDPVVKSLGIPYIIGAIILVRITSSLGVCREENGPGCATTFYEPGSSLTPLWALFAVSLVSLALPIFLARFYIIGQNYVGIAKIFVRGTTAAMVFITLYWSIDTAEVRGHLDPAGFEIFKVFLARLLLAISIIGGTIIWYRSNLTIAVNVQGEKPKIEGYNNVYGSYATVPIITLFWALYIVNKPPGYLALTGLAYLIFVLFDVLDLVGAKYTLLAPFMFNIIGQIYFYSTGHQATLVSIQWDTAFIASTKLAYPISAITVSLNTGGAILLTAIASVLVATWRRPPFKDPRLLLAYTVRAGVGASIVASIQTLACMAAVALLRRHLMTWKIFAPRFIYGSIFLVVVDIGVFIGLLISGHALSKVTDIFG